MAMLCFTTLFALPLSFASQPPDRTALLLAHQKILQESSAPRRSPRRASPDSTFARFLAGHSQPYEVARRRSDGAADAPVVNVVAFGADPTGNTDSSQAFEQAVQSALKHGANKTMAEEIKDLGGVVIDLQGGDYLMSRPVSVPSLVGNLKIVRGTLRAAGNFPQDRYLIEIGETQEACKAKYPKQKSCNENIGIEDLMLDGSLRAHGGIQVNATMGANVGPDMFFVGFRVAGITINGGHETMVHEAWFAQTYYGDKRHTDPALVDGTIAAEINGNDHILSDIIVFGAQLGVFVGGGANLIEGVHTWNLATGLGGHGIIVTAGSTRIDACYLDYNALVIEDPRHVSVTNSFFLGMGTVVLRAKAGTLDGLLMMANTWANYNMPHNDTVVLDEGTAAFSSVKDFVMVGNTANADKFTTRAVRVTKTLTLKKAKRWEFNFTDSFVFPSLPIQSAQYSITIEGSSFARHAARPANGHTVAVETDEDVDATVTLTASQVEFSPGNDVAKGLVVV